MNPTGRFSSRASDYVKYRPSYPPDVVRLLASECGLRPDSTVADIGCGTGFLAELFLKFGCRVIGVEPNREMREAGENFLAEYPRFQSREGRAEHTGLPDQCADLVAVAQAFHWFDQDATRAEFLRIARPPRHVTLIWNERVVPDEGFLRGYENLLRRHAPEYILVDGMRTSRESITNFFGGSGWKQASFDNRQVLDHDGLYGRLMSSSYAPQEDSAGYPAMIEELDRLFREYQEDGRVAILYRTDVYYGTLED